MNSEADVVNYFIARARKEQIDVMKVQATTMSGIPDLNACCEGTEIWIEMKLETAKGVLLRPEQWAWGHRRAAADGRVYIIAVSLDRLWTRVWKFPNVIGNPCGKYVKVVSDSSYAGYLDDQFNHMTSFLFT